MKSIHISKSEDGITLIKYLRKIFKSMPSSLIQKLVRKKYFDINDKRAKGDEILKTDDMITIHLSDETFNKYCTKQSSYKNASAGDIDYTDRIIYEDENVIIFNKPIGILSQGDKSGNQSVNSILNDYLGNINSSFKPSVVNRLDRNTEGLIIFAKTYIAAKEISSMIKNNKIEKRYKASVNGLVEEDSGELENLYKKNEKDNKAVLKKYNGKVPEGYSLAKLRYRVLKKHKETTDIDVELITGKSHQIRAQFAYIGHPLVSDKKYMDIELYNDNVKKYGCRSQKLVCYKIKFGTFSEEALKNLSNKTYKV